MNRFSSGILTGSVALGLGVTPMLAQSGGGARDSAAARLAVGRTLFEGKGLCFSCHGKNGEGLLGPSTRLAGRKLIHTKPTLPEVIVLIKEGVDSAHTTNGQAMPARGGSRLSDAEVVAVAAYVLDLQKRTGPK